LTIKKKFVLALIAYGVLGLLVWTTMSDQPIQISDWNLKPRTGMLLVLAVLVSKSGLYYWRTRIEEERDRAKSVD